MNRELTYQPKDSYLRVATACPEVALADVPTNIDRINEIYYEANEQNVSIVTFPELSITGYTLGDLVQQNSLLKQAEEGLIELADTTENKTTAMVVGLPLRFGNGLYNCAAVLAEGKIQGIIPKINLPTYNEFYEDRWYDTWQNQNTNIDIGGESVPFGTNLIFDIAGSKLGVEICEDLWVVQPPSESLAVMGAQVIANPSASPEQIGKANYRRKLVELQSGRLIAGYLYAGCDVTESTAEIVMGGHQLIADNGNVKAENKPFGGERLVISEIDIEHIEADRRKQHMASKIGAEVIKTNVTRSQNELLASLDPNPFLPEESSADRDERLKAAIDIQANGLAIRLRRTPSQKLVLGLSGGLDSTLALLVACEAAEILGRDPKDVIQTITMPGYSSSEKTQSNAQLLAIQLGVKNKVIAIGEVANIDMIAIDHDAMTQDITYENAQARARTTLLFNYANKNGGIVLGTGDLSEIALGWCTYNADQQSHYNVNATIPKTMVKHLVGFMANQPKYKEARDSLISILETPISPELTGNGFDEISQNTEDIIGPYELHDFFLYHLVRWGDSPAKIRYLAEQTYAGTYDSKTVNKWFDLFIKRFANNQFKRENIPNGPKVGSVSLSPRGDWRMPPDLYNAAIWNN